MVMRNRRTIIRTILLAIALLLLLAIFVYPIIIVFINSIKPVGEILGAPLSLPKTVQLSNFIQAWKITSMGKLLRNSAILTICSVSAVVVFSAMSAYWCHRYRNAVTRTFTALLMVSMLIPFASLMIPLVKITTVLHINNTPSRCNNRFCRRRSCLWFLYDAKRCKNIAPGTGRSCGAGWLWAGSNIFLHCVSAHEKYGI